MSFATQMEARVAVTTLANEAAHDDGLSPAKATDLERVVLNELERLGRIEDAARVLIQNMPSKSIERLRELVG